MSMRMPSTTEVMRQGLSILLGLFFIATLLIPAAAFNKVIFGALVAMACAAYLMARTTPRFRTAAPVVIAAVFFYGYSIAFLRETDRDLGLQFLLSVSVLFLIYPIDWFDIDLDRIVKVSGVLLATGTIGLFLLFFFLLDGSSSGDLQEVFARVSLGAFGQREVGDQQVLMFHLGTAPFLFLPFSLLMADLLESRNPWVLLALLVIGVAVISSSSRGLMVACLASAGFLGIRKVPRRHVMPAVGIGAIGVACLLYYAIAHTEWFSLGEAGNSIKVGHARSFFDSLTLPGMLFGNGLGSTYYSLGLGRPVAHTEITPLDLARYFGVPLTALVYWAILFPVRFSARWDAKAQAAFVLVVIYLLLGLTNPVLVNSFGLLTVLWYWSKVLKSQGDADAA